MSILSRLFKVKSNQPLITDAEFDQLKVAQEQRNRFQINSDLKILELLQVNHKAQ